MLADYGAFRDLQRHRTLTIEWQALSPRHGFTRPEAVDAAGAGRRFDEAMDRSASLYDVLSERFPAEAVLRRLPRLQGPLRHGPQRPGRHAHARAAHLAPGPPRLPARWPSRCTPLIAEQAGHHAVAEMMRYVDHSAEPGLERLDAERRAESKRLSR